MTDDMESISFSEIKGALDDTIKLVNTANLELKAQYDAWTYVKDEIKKDDADYRSLREQLTQIQTMQDGEIIRLKKTLDAAQRPSIYADALNLFISFLTGVLSTVLAPAVASMLYSLWRRIRRIGASFKHSDVK